MNGASLAVLLLVVGAAVGCQPRAEVQSIRTVDLSSGGKVEETRLDAWEPLARQPEPVVSPDGRHAACVVRWGRGQAVALDGKPGPGFNEIGGIGQRSGCIGYDVCGQFTDDSQHFAYLGRRGSRWHCGCDGQIGPGYASRAKDVMGHSVRWAGLVGGHCAFSVQGKDKSFFVVDGKSEPAFPEVRQFVFSLDGRHHAYDVRTASGTAILRDGAQVYESTSTEPPRNLLFSPDGARLAFTHGATIRTANYPNGTLATTVVLQGERRWTGGENGQVWTMIFSPDSRHVAWLENDYNGKRAQVAVDGQFGPRYERINYLCFSPDSSRVVYVGQRPDKRMALVQGTEQTAVYDDIRPLWAASDNLASRREDRGLSAQADVPPTAFFLRDGRQLAYVARHDGVWSVVRDGVMATGYRSVNQAAYSADYRHLAYFAGTLEGKTVLVVDGKPSQPFDGSRSLPVFSPNSRRVAYGIGLGDFRVTREVAHLVVDGHVGPAAAMVSTPVFSPDSRHVAYYVMSQGKCWSVVDGATGPQYERILGEAICSKVACLAPDGALEYLAIHDGALYRVRHLPTPNR